MSSELKIKAVRLKGQLYVDGRGRKQSFTVGEATTGLEKVYSIEKTAKGIVMISEDGFDKLSRIVEVMDADVAGIYYYDD